VSPGWNPFRWPPYKLHCKNCGLILETSFNHRATWLSWSIWEISWVLITVLCAMVTFLEDYSIGESVGILVVGSLLFGGGGGFILSIVFALPGQLLLDLIHGIVIKARGPQTLEHQPDGFDRGQTPQNPDLP
jgi:hypothetical protein